MSKRTLTTSFHDLSDDFAELAFLFNSTVKKIDEGLKELEKKRKFIPTNVYGDLITQLHELKDRYCALVDETSQCKKLVQQGTSLKELEMLISHKRSLSHELRSYQLIVSALLLSTDWQSPTFFHTLESLAGRQTGEIKATVNDYKRDFHLDEVSYESLFTKEYVEVLMRSVLYTYVVNSGMAALTTIIFFLKAEGQTTGPVLLGRSSYFENKELIHAAFSGQVVEVDETDTEKLCQYIAEEKPAILFLDTLCNNATVTLPNTKKILSFIEKNTRHDMTIVLDNTGLSFFLQPLTSSLLTNRRIRLIVFESLNKYHQFGMDRVTGGFIYAHGKNTGKLFLAREHAGTNSTDVSVLTLPYPSRKYLERRMLRLGRNAACIAEELQRWIEEHLDSPLAQIYYPTLPTHLSFQWAKKERFAGSYFSFGFKKKYQDVKFYQTFIREIMEKAMKERVQLVSGTSFGMNTSRIYLTALRSDIAEPFIRFSVGTETQYEVEKIASILKTTMASI